MAETTLHRIKGDAYDVVDPSEAETGEITHEYGMHGFCYRGGRVTIARYHVTFDAEMQVIGRTLEFVHVLRGSVPHLNLADGDVFLSVPLTEDELGALYIFSMQIGPGDSFFVWYTKESGIVRLARIYNTGAIAAETSYSGDTNAANESIFFGTELVNVGGDPKLFTLELIEGAADVSGPPFSQNTRLVRRNAITLEIEASFAVANIASKDGWAIRTSGIAAFVAAQGKIRAYYYYVKNPPGGADTKVFYQDYSYGLVPIGSDAPDPLNPSPFMAFGNQVAVHPAGGIIMTTAGLRRRALDLSTNVTVLASFESDLGGRLGIAQLNTGLTLIVGRGVLFTTSLLSDGGQELP